MSRAHEGDEVAELFNVVLPDVPLTDILGRIATLATRAVPAATFAGITLPQEGGAATPVYTDERAPRVDQAQYDHDSGPCLDALRTGEVFRIADTVTESRWRPFCELAHAEGIRSMLSTPLDVANNRESVIGALNLYSEAPESFDDEAVRATQTFAHQAAILVANARAYWGAVEVSEQLQKAMESRATIEQAKGIIIAQSHVSPEEAFQLLVRASQRESRKLREIAAELVKRAMEPGSRSQANT